MRLAAPHITASAAVAPLHPSTASRQKGAEFQAEAEEEEEAKADNDSTSPTCYCYSTADAEEVKSLVLATMEKPKKDTILQLMIIWIGLLSVNSLECYDSSYPVPHRRTECGPNMVSF